MSSYLLRTPFSFLTHLGIGQGRETLQRVSNCYSVKSRLTFAPPSQSKSHKIKKLSKERIGFPIVNIRILYYIFLYLSSIISIKSYWYSATAPNTANTEANIKAIIISLIITQTSTNQYLRRSLEHKLNPQ